MSQMEVQCLVVLTKLRPSLRDELKVKVFQFWRNQSKDKVDFT